MSLGTEPGPESAALTRERILRAAIDLADEGGIESLSMRSLARRLGAGAMSLYYYVADKDELVAGIVDLVVREIELPAEGADWRAALRGTSMSARRALLRHPWAASLMFSTGDGPARLGYMESMLRTLRRGGFSAAVAHRAYHALDSHIIGFTLWEASIPFTADELLDLASSFAEQIPDDRYPYLAEHIQQHLIEAGDAGDDAFEFGLDLILGSLERSVAAA